MKHIPDILCALVILRPVTLQLERHCYRKAPRSTPPQEVTMAEETQERINWRKFRKWPVEVILCYSEIASMIVLQQGLGCGSLWCFFQTRQHTVQVAPAAAATRMPCRAFTDGPSPSWLALSDSFVAHPALQPKWSSTNQILFSYRCNIIIIICRYEILRWK